MHNFNNQNLTDLLKRVGLFDKSFTDSIKSLYKRLNLYVHLKPPTDDEDLDLYFSEFKQKEWREFHNSFFQVIKIIEVLLIIKFPKIVSTRGIGKQINEYKNLQLSKQQIDELVKFSSSI